MRPNRLARRPRNIAAFSVPQGTRGIARLCGLTEEEFVHILRTFPLAPDPVKVAAQNAYRDVERKVVQ